MRNKIKNIRIKEPKISSLPDGYYNGIWTGYSIDVNYKGKDFELETEEGIRGGNVKVIVEISNGIATFDEIKS